MNGCTIQNVEIFRAGNYGDMGAFSASDLDAIASDYSADRHEAPLTVDHKQDGPAYGWIRNLRRLGEKLFADFHDVHPEFAAAIKAGAFKQRSAEIYKAFAATGRPYLKAVTMLGAAAPAVKGMAPIKFADPGEAVEFDAEPLAVATFGEFPKAPEGAPAFGTLVSQHMTGDMGDHYHNAFLDADRNGYTGPPRPSYEVSSDSHQHAVVAGAIQAAGEPPHTHPLTIFKIEKTGEVAMSEPAAPAPAAPAAPDPHVAEFAEIKTALASETAKREAAEARVARLESERRDERESVRFEAAFSEAVAAGRVFPAEKAAAFAVFSALPHDDAEGVATFGEAKSSPRETFLASFAARPKAIEFGDALPSGVSAFAANDKTASFDDRVDAEVMRRMTEKGLAKDQYPDVLKTVVAEFSAKR